MTKMFGNLTSTSDLEEATDRVGGGFEPLPTDVYPGTIKLAYAGQSSKGAGSITLHCDLGGKEYRETIYITNRNGENYYVDKKDPKKRHPLPGFTHVNDICLFTTGVDLSEQETEEKIVAVYDFDQGKEVNTPVQCLTALHDQPISLAIQRVISDKNKLNQATNKYEPTGETRTDNNIVKVLHPDNGTTVNECKSDVETPEFRDAWIKKNQNKDYDKSTKQAGGGAGAAGSGKPDFGGNASNAPKANIFGKK